MMKHISRRIGFSLVLLALCFALAACAALPQPVQQTEQQPVQQPAQEPVQQPEQLPITQPDAATPVITRQPTDQTVDEGGNLTLVAQAENYTEIAWRFVDSSEANVVMASDAAAFFGCTVYGESSEALVISGVPASLDGWRAEAMFRGPGGTAYSWGALIHVKAAASAAPAVEDEAPSAADLEAIGSNIVYPKKSQYLDRKVTVYITPWKDVSIYAFSDPANTVKPTFLAEPGLQGIAIAETSGFSCVIFPELDRAGWVNWNYLATDPYAPDVNAGSPGASDLDAVYSHIVYPKTNQYLSSYRKCTVDPPNGQGVYAFVDPVKNTKDYYFVVMPGEKVTVLAQAHGFSCVILDDQGRAAWINSDYLH